MRKRKRKHIEQYETPQLVSRDYIGTPAARRELEKKRVLERLLLGDGIMTYATLSKELRVSRQLARECINELRKLGLIYETPKTKLCFRIRLK